MPKSASAPTSVNHVPIPSPSLLMPSFKFSPKLTLPTQTRSISNQPLKQSIIGTLPGISPRCHLSISRSARIYYRNYINRCMADIMTLPLCRPNPIQCVSYCDNLASYYFNHPLPGTCSLDDYCQQFVGKLNDLDDPPFYPGALCTEYLRTDNPVCTREELSKLFNLNYPDCPCKPQCEAGTKCCPSMNNACIPQQRCS